MLFNSLALQAEPYLSTNQDPPTAISPSSSASVVAVVDERKQARFVASLLSLFAANDNSSKNNNDSDSDDITNGETTSVDVDTAVADIAGQVHSRTRVPLLKVTYGLFPLVYSNLLHTPSDI